MLIHRSCAWPDQAILGNCSADQLAKTGIQVDLNRRKTSVNKISVFILLTAEYLNSKNGKRTMHVLNWG